MVKSHCRTLSDIFPSGSDQSLPQCLSWRACVYIACQSYFFKPPLCSRHFELKISKCFLSEELPSSRPPLLRWHVMYYVLITCRPGNQSKWVEACCGWSVCEVYQVESWKKEKDGKIYLSEQIKRRVNVAGCWCLRCTFRLLSFE